MAVRRLTLVRHGDTVGESSLRYHGMNDVALNEVGRGQMARVAQALGGERFDAVYCSQLQRARAGARIIAPALEPRALQGFNEVHFGRWEGLTREEIERADPELFVQWRRSAGDFRYPDGDDVAGFRARVASTWRELAVQAPECVLIVAHRGVISAILMETLELTPDELRSWRIGLGSIHVVVHGDDGWRAEGVDVHDHLDDASRLVGEG